MSERKHKIYLKLTENFPDVMSDLESLGNTIRSSGPLDKKESHLVQLAAAAAIQSEGAVHSHTIRALVAGATKEEIEHTIILLISTIGLPKTAAALSWAYDVIEKESVN